MRSDRRFASTLASVTLLVSACVTSQRRSPPATLSPSLADTLTTIGLAPGVALHHLVRVAGPLRIDVLDIDLARCVSLRAVKGGPTAVGRRTTSALLQSLPATDHAIAAINADFFSFAPPGVPVGALVEASRLIAGPIDRPVLAIDAQQRPFIGTLTVRATITSQRASMVATSWNRPRHASLGIVDAAWGQALDSVIRPTARLLVPIASDGARHATRYRVLPLPPLHTSLATADTLLLTGLGSAALADGDTVAIAREWSPITPHTAVGGFPLLLRDSAVVATVDTDGAAGFRALNPRTAVGISADGRRLLLIVVDGRHPGFSVGTTTRETAELLRALGAVSAVNLDGGGSSALVVRDTSTGATRLVNRPSDAAGERPVANALAVLRGCGREVR